VSASLGCQGWFLRCYPQPDYPHNSGRSPDEQNARITSDKVVGDELLKHITTNFDLYKLYSDNKEFKEDFSAMMFGVVKEILKTGLNANV